MIGLLAWVTAAGLVPYLWKLPRCPLMRSLTRLCCPWAQAAVGRGIFLCDEDCTEKEFDVGVIVPTTTELFIADLFLHYFPDLLHSTNIHMGIFPPWAVSRKCLCSDLNMIQWAISKPVDRNFMSSLCLVIVVGVASD